MMDYEVYYLTFFLDSLNLKEISFYFLAYLTFLNHTKVGLLISVLKIYCIFDARVGGEDFWTLLFQ